MKPGVLLLAAGVLCAAVEVGIGLPTGLIAGYYGGKFDAVASWFVNVTLSLPGIIVLLAVRAAVLDPLARSRLDTGFGLHALCAKAHTPQAAIAHLFSLYSVRRVMPCVSRGL